MKIFVVLYEIYTNEEIEVLDVYAHEESANNRVKYERDLIEGIPNVNSRDECWYVESELIS